MTRVFTLCGEIVELCDAILPLCRLNPHVSGDDVDLVETLLNHLRTTVASHLSAVESTASDAPCPDLTNLVYVVQHVRDELEGCLHRHGDIRDRKTLELVLRLDKVCYECVIRSLCGEPPAWSLSSRGRCMTCGTVECDDTTLKTCARCSLVAYCGKECQRRDWVARHKRSCGRYAELRSSVTKAIANEAAAVIIPPLDVLESIRQHRASASSRIERRSSAVVPPSAARPVVYVNTAIKINWSSHSPGGVIVDTTWESIDVVDAAGVTKLAHPKITLGTVVRDPSMYRTLFERAWAAAARPVTVGTESFPVRMIGFDAAYVRVPRSYWLNDDAITDDPRDLDVSVKSLIKNVNVGPELELGCPHLALYVDHASDRAGDQLVVLMCLQLSVGGPNDRTCVLTHVVVSPAWRRKGMATQLLKIAEGVAIEMQQKHITLMALPAHERVWNKSGYVRTPGTGVVDSGHIHMGKSLIA